MNVKAFYTYDSAQTSGQTFMKYNRIIGGLWSAFGACYLMSKITELEQVRYVVSWSRAIFIMDKSYQRSICFGTHSGKLCELIEFELAIVDT